MELNQNKPLPQVNPTANSSLKPSETSDSKNDPKYAESVAAMAMLDYQLQEKSNPEPKHLISKKVIWYLVISTVISIVGLGIYNFANRDKPDQSTQQIEQLLKSTQEIRELQSE